MAVIEDFTFDKISTKAMADLLKSIGFDGSVLMIIGDSNETILKSARNLDEMTLRVAPTVSVYDVLSHDFLVVTRSAAGRLEETYGK
jgi:large subunit ribosomal protein L4